MTERDNDTIVKCDHRAVATDSNDSKKVAQVLLLHSKSGADIANVLQGQLETHGLQVVYLSDIHETCHTVGVKGSGRSHRNACSLLLFLTIRARDN